MVWRKGCFPVGVRVLVVDVDPACQRSLDKKLTKWKYDVTKSMQAQDALNLIEREKEKFDIVISETKLPDMDGFKFVEVVRRLKLDLPVILMSGDDDYNMMEKGLKSGACDFLLKPIKERELCLRIVWQHLQSKKEALFTDATPVGNDEEASTSTAVVALSMKRNDHSTPDSLKINDHYHSAPPPLKKFRMTWTEDLHRIFLDSVNEIGMDKITPKKILQLMNDKVEGNHLMKDKVEGLTREHIASHTQKYRESLKKKKFVSAPANGGVNSNTVLPASASETMPMPIRMEGGGERVGFVDHSMSYNQCQRLMGLQNSAVKPPESTMIVTPTTWNGGAAFNPQQLHVHQLPPVSHNPAFPTKEAGVNNHLYWTNRSEFTNSMSLRPLEQMSNVGSSLVNKNYGIRESSLVNHCQTFKPMGHSLRIQDSYALAKLDKYIADLR